MTRGLHSPRRTARRLVPVHPRLRHPRSGWPWRTVVTAIDFVRWELSMFGPWGGHRRRWTRL